VIRLSDNQKRGVGIAAIGVFLLTTWFCRAKPEPPVAAGEALFRVRESHPATDMAAVVVHAPEGMGQMRLAGSDGDPMDELVGPGGRRLPMTQDSYTPPPRMIRAQHDEGGEDRGLFDMSDLDPFAGETKRSDSGGWGWLADDVNASTPDPFERLGNGRTTDRERRFLGDDDDDTLRSGFLGSGNDSENGSYFRRRDRRF